MLHEANTFVAHAHEHLLAQEARIVQQDLKGRQRAESTNLLRNMRQTLSLMMGHMTCWSRR